MHICRQNFSTINCNRKIKGQKRLSHLILKIKNKEEKDKESEIEVIINYENYMIYIMNMTEILQLLEFNKKMP